MPGAGRQPADGAHTRTLATQRCDADAWVLLPCRLAQSLALGHDCFVIDYASRNKKRGVPRALWCALAQMPARTRARSDTSRRYGLEFVTFALDTLWLGAPVRPPVLRGMSVGADFQQKLSRFDKATRQRLRYYARFAPPQDGVRLWVRACRHACVCW